MKNLIVRLITISVLFVPVRGLAAPVSAQGSQNMPCSGVLQVAAQDPQLMAIRQNLCQFIEKARLADLRWPNFSDYRAQLKDFYQSSNNSLVWVTGNQPTAQARSIIQILQSAEKKGLRPDDYDSPRWADRLARFAPGQQLSPADLAHFDVALTVSVMRYISDLHNGRVNPKQFEFGLNVNRRKYKLADFLRTQVVSAPQVAPVLEQVEPPFPAYRRTIAALDHYLVLAKEGDGQPLVVSKKSIKPDEPYGNVPQLAERLRRLGDLAPDVQVPADSTVYQGPVVEAVKRFQQRHGLTADGSLGKETFRELNMPLNHRVQQLQLALERWRWLPQDLQAPMVMVNIPEFHLIAYDDLQRPSLSMNVVVGKSDEDHKTPVFADRMSYIIFRPYWKVPDSIIQDEIIPNIQKDPAYLAKHQYEMVNKQGEIIITDMADPGTIQKLETGDLEVRQKPGTSNALGLVKFVFPNSFDVYLHGTPERQLFSRTRRTFSHGCIRVEDPVALASWVLHDPHTWTTEKIKAAMNGKKDGYQINLPKPIPVLILYATAMVRENGEVNFFNDVYEYDADLQHALTKGYPYPY